MSLRTIRVAVAHEDFLTRTGLMTVLAACDDMSLEAANTDDLSLAACDAIVADFLGGQRIPFNLRRARTIQHRGRVMVVADADREWQVREALESGAAAYLLLDATAGGASYLSPPVAARLAESLAADPLTGRGQQVLSLIVDALCNKRIASRLQISVGTVESHMRSLFDKLNVRTRTAAAATAARRGLLRRRINSTGIDPEGGAAMGLAIPPPGRDRGNRVREGVPEQTTLLLQA